MPYPFSNLESYQWIAYFGVLFELVGLMFLFEETRRTVSAWRQRVKHGVAHLRTISEVVAVGSAVESEGSPIATPTTWEQLEKIDARVTRLERETIPQLTTALRQDTNNKIRRAEEHLRTDVASQVNSAVRPIEEFLDATSNPWRAYLGSALLIAGLAVTSTVNTIHMSP